jgi:signal transduction histidine kinase
LKVFWNLPGTERCMLRMAAQVERFEAGGDDELVDLAPERDRLYERMLDAEELERRRIAHDIHDDTISTMSAVELECARLRAVLSDETQIEIADRIARTVDAAVDRLRHLMFQLEPKVLHREGLGSAIRVLLEDLSSLTDIDYRLDDRTGGGGSHATRTVAFRVAKEALANVRKHSWARMVHVAVAPLRGGVDVRITDDGLGFDVAAGGSADVGHLGLSSMRERIEEAGGSFLVDSCPGLGTTVDFWLPGTVTNVQSERDIAL